MVKRALQLKSADVVGITFQTKPCLARKGRQCVPHPVLNASLHRVVQEYCLLHGTADNSSVNCHQRFRSWFVNPHRSTALRLGRVEFVSEELRCGNRPDGLALRFTSHTAFDLDPSGEPASAFIHVPRPFFAGRGVTSEVDGDSVQPGGIEGA